MKENTKYHNYRFLGKINVDEIQPWFDFASAKPWDESEIPWVLDNRVRREILIELAKGSKSFKELNDVLYFSPEPLLITKKEYECKVRYQWTKETLENHLLSLEWYNLIKKENDRYTLNFPILNSKKMQDLEKYIIKFAKNWINIVKETNSQITTELKDTEQQKYIFEILVEKSIDKLYELLKNEKILPEEPNLKVIWAEQLREIKFEEWLKKNF